MLDSPHKAGDRLSASRLNARRGEIARLGELRGGGSIGARSGSGGSSLTSAPEPDFYLKLTSVASGTKYAWKEVVPATGGTWTDTGNVGSVASDPAYEVNASTTLTVDNAVYPATRGETTGEVLFRKTKCPPANDGWISLPGCNCSPIPPTIYMDSIDPTCEFGALQDATIVYGPVPSEFEDLSLGDNAFISTDYFTDDNSLEFKYLLTCNGSAFSIARLIINFPAIGLFREPPIYSWIIGDTGNTCDPFLMSNGFIYFGGDPACDVDLSE